MKILPKHLQVEFESLNFVFEHIVPALIVNVFVGLALLAVMHDAPGVEWATAWYFGLLSVVGIRYAIFHLYRRSTNKITRFNRWKLAYMSGALLMGLAWGVGGVLLFPAEDTGRQIFLCFIIGGMSMGAVPYLAPLLPAYWLFLISSVLPINLHLLTFSDKLHLSLSGVGFLFAFSMLAAARLNHKNFIHNFNLRYTNDELVNRLNEINDELENKIVLKNKVEQDLLENEQRLKVLASAVHEGVILHSENSIIEANEAAARMCGYSVKEMLGKTLMDFIEEENKEKVFQHLKGTDDEPFEANFIRKNGTVFRAEFNPGEVTYRGNPARIFSVRDISRQKQIEKDLRHAKNAAEEADKLKTEFLASVSHELRTPLNAISGVFQIMQDAKLSKHEIEYMDMGSKAAKQLIFLIDDLLDLSRIESGHVEYHYQDVNLYALLYEVIQLMSFKARERDNELKLSLSEDLPEYAHIEPDRLRQVLLNLLGNAIKFTERGTVSLTVDLQSTTGKQNVLHFVVRDNGIGIPEEKQDQIFNQFTQLDSSASRNYGGAGLGLAICRELVTRMQGDIGVKSKVGDGASFWFDIPFTAASSSETIPVQQNTDSYDTEELQGCRVLLVEDEKTNQIITNQMLSKMGCLVTVLDNGQQAVEDEGDYDLILMDVQMPVLDGLSATRQLREKGTKIPIIALTAYAMQEDRKKCLAAGMDDYLSKPIDFEQMIQTLMRWLPAGRQAASH